jgi:hypothetical protein
VTLRIARCHCGQFDLRCEGEPTRVSMCHCLDCQRRTGGAFSVAVFYDREKVTLPTTEGGVFERPSASGFPVRFHFCLGCGTNLYWEPARMPERVGVAVGAFGDPDFPRPEQSVWTKDKHAWLALPEDMPAFETNPPPRPPSA